MGLPALDAEGVPLPPLLLILIFFLGPAPSDISPAVASPSLPDPAPPWALRFIAVCCNDGVPARLPIAGVEVLNFCFRVDSFPLDSERVGEPARLTPLPFLPRSACFLLCGVLPLDPEGLDLSLRSLESPCPSLESSLFSSSFSSSSSEDDSDYDIWLAKE